MACASCANLPLCACHHPPLATFLLCTLTLAAFFLGFGLYVRAYPVKDADFTKDLDTVLQTLSAAAICPQRNASAADVSPQPLQGSSVSPASAIGSLSVLVSVTLSPWQPSANRSGLQIRATTSQLGMKVKGPGADPHLLLTLSSSWWSAQCNNSDSKCSGKFCVTVTGLQSALPLSWSPYQCSAANPGGHNLLQELYVLEEESGNSSKCYSLQYTGDPDLKATMSQEDALTCSSHLLVAMLVCSIVAVTLFVVSACCIRPIKDKRTPGAL